MIHAKLAVTLRLRPITRQSSPNHVLTHTTTRAYDTGQTSLLILTQKPVAFQETSIKITPIYHTSHL